MLQKEKSGNPAPPLKVCSEIDRKGFNPFDKEFSLFAKVAINSFLIFAFQFGLNGLNRVFILPV
jgi:hypothetical protein